LIAARALIDTAPHWKYVNTAGSYVVMESLGTYVNQKRIHLRDAFLVEPPFRVERITIVSGYLCVAVDDPGVDTENNAFREGPSSNSNASLGHHAWKTQCHLSVEPVCFFDLKEIST
jgi:hypothetical protein